MCFLYNICLSYERERKERNLNKCLQHEHIPFSPPCATLGPRLNKTPFVDMIQQWYLLFLNTFELTTFFKKTLLLFVLTTFLK